MCVSYIGGHNLNFDYLNGRFYYMHYHSFISKTNTTHSHTPELLVRGKAFYTDCARLGCLLLLFKLPALIK